MLGKRYTEVIEKLVTNGRWRIGDSEEGWTELYRFDTAETVVLEIGYKNGIIKSIYKYSY